jgi:hypothetical protein
VAARAGSNRDLDTLVVPVASDDPGDEDRIIPTIVGNGLDDLRGFLDLLRGQEDLAAFIATLDAVTLMGVLGTT